MDNFSKMSTERTRNARAVVAGMEEQGEEVAQKISALLFDGDAARRVTVAELVAALVRRLGVANDEFDDADSAHTTETAGDFDARAARDAAHTALHEALVTASQVVLGALGKQAQTSMGLGGIEWQPRGDRLSKQARTTIGLMRERRTFVPRAPGVVFDAEALARSIEERCDALDAALAEVLRENKRAHKTFQRRAAALKVWDRTYPGIAEIFTGLCLLGEFDELAQRVKPTARKARGVQTDHEDDVPEPVGAPSGADGETNGNGAANGHDVTH